MEFSVSSRCQGDTAIVEVGGDIDLTTVDELYGQIATALGTDESTSVIVDLSAVTFLDSTGISALLKGRRLADRSGKQYTIAGADGVVRQLLDLTGVWAHLSNPTH